MIGLWVGLGVLAAMVLAAGIGTAGAWLVIGHNPYHRGPCPPDRVRQP